MTQSEPSFTACKKETLISLFFLLVFSINLRLTLFQESKEMRSGAVPGYLATLKPDNYSEF